MNIAYINRAARLILVFAAVSVAGCTQPMPTNQVEAIQATVDGLIGDVGRVQTEATSMRTNLEDLRTNALRRKALEVPGCYGRGHDLIFHHLGADQTEALQALRACFEENVQTEFYFFGNPEPARLTDLQGLVGFIENFAITTGYHTARNTPGNAAVELTGPSTATLISSGATPHFSLAPTDGGAAFSDLVSARYSHDLTLGADGVWRTTHFVIHIEEILRTQGAYPLGQ
jgi:hypothetical protein